MDYLMEVGKRIRARRKALGISQQELAEAVGYTQKGMISQIENGKVNMSMDKAIAIADYLGMKPHELLKETKERAELDQIIEEIQNYSPDNLIRLRAYMELIRSVETWQQQSGTVEGGGSGSASTVASVLSQIQPPDEEAEKQLRSVRESAAASLSSQPSPKRGEDTSKR